MKLTKKQEEGLRIAVARYCNHEKYTVIAGYAGTGKSTLVRFIIEALHVDQERVCYATFTGKAADVLRQKGNKNACTLHRLLFESIPLPNGKYLRKRKPFIDYDVVVVDEISMVPKSIIDVLFSHKVYIICLGDPFQLPPVQKDDDNHLLDKPHIFLDQIMRQATDSEIIQLSMAVRERKHIGLYNGTNVKIFDSNSLTPGMCLWADQIIVAKNKTRNYYNSYMRNLAGRGPNPEVGDKVICCRNYWEDFSNEGDPLVNGSIGYLDAIEPHIITIPRWVKVKNHEIETLFVNINTDKTCYSGINIDKHMLLTGEKFCDFNDAYQIGKNKNRIGDIMPREFQYGYAITGHKAQGSEYDKVLVIEEEFPWNEVEHARWLYTAITRAADKLVLIRK